MAPPISGATIKSQTWLSAVPPTMSAGNSAGELGCPVADGFPHRDPARQQSACCYRRIDVTAGHRPEHAGQRSGTSPNASAVATTPAATLPPSKPKPNIRVATPQPKQTSSAVPRNSAPNFRYIIPPQPAPSPAPAPAGHAKSVRATRLLITRGAGGNIYDLCTIQPGNRRDFRAQSRSATGFVRVPMLWIVTDTSSPLCSGPTPAGVPVSSTSPGSRVMTALT